jgi:single-stranded DNA-binding protein
LLTTNRRYKHGKEWKDRTESHSCVVYGDSLNVGDHAFREGSHILIEGELAYRQYDRRIETESGPVNVKWPIAEIIVHSVAALNGHPKEGAAA